MRRSPRRAWKRKRRLPRFPQRIGLVTSPTGAAMQDVLHVIRRRNPGLEIVLAPCRVQGEGAAEEVAAAIALLNEFNRARMNQADLGHFGSGAYLDLILVTRGGGSLEDLWAFNEEVVARAIFHSGLPVVSAVGHEIDFTISDFVADLRAATPSAAAELITEGVFASSEFVAGAPGRMEQLVRRHLGDMAGSVSQASQRLSRMHPRRRLEAWLQRLDDLQAVMLRCARQGARRHAIAWRNLADRLSRVRPSLLFKQRRELLRQEAQRLQEHFHHRLRTLNQEVASLTERLRLLGPEQVLTRGYSITMQADTGKVLRAQREAKPGMKLRTRLKSGEIRSVVEGPG